MNKKVAPAVSYTRNPNWAIVYENNLLVLNAGADMIYAIEDVSETIAEEILMAWNAKVIRTDSLSREAREIFEQLKTAQIIRIGTKLPARPRVAIRFVGKINIQLQRELNSLLSKDFNTAADDDSDLLLLVRTNAMLANVLSEGYDDIRVPHLFVDLAFEHSVSLGPLVYYGETACVGCLTGRLSTYWGDAVPPANPKILENTGLLAGMIHLEVRTILQDYGRELVNTTVAYDFRNHTVKKNSIYKLPMCPVCSITAMDNPGAITLPWAQKERQKI